MIKYFVEKLAYFGLLTELVLELKLCSRNDLIESPDPPSVLLSSKLAFTTVVAVDKRVLSSWVVLLTPPGV